MAQPLRRLVRWLGGTDRDKEVKPTCPLCGSQLVGPYRAGGWSRLSGAPFYIEPSREELIAKCPTHGHPPYNAPGGHSSRQFWNSIAHAKHLRYGEIVAYCDNLEPT